MYTRLDKAGNPRTGYKSGFGDVPALLYSNQALIDAEFRSEDFIDFPMPGPKDKRAKKPFLKDMSDEEYAEAWENHRQYLHELDVYRSLSTFARTFSSLRVASLSCMARSWSTIFA